MNQIFRHERARQSALYNPRCPNIRLHRVAVRWRYAMIVFMTCADTMAERPLLQSAAEARDDIVLDERVGQVEFPFSPLRSTRSLVPFFWSSFRLTCRQSNTARLSSFARSSDSSPHPPQPRLDSLEAEFGCPLSLALAAIKNFRFRDHHGIESRIWIHWVP